MYEGVVERTRWAMCTVDSMVDNARQRHATLTQPALVIAQAFDTELFPAQRRVRAFAHSNFALAVAAMKDKLGRGQERTGRYNTCSLMITPMTGLARPATKTSRPCP